VPPRVKTWLPGFDDALGGGFPDGCVAALMGGPTAVHELFGRQLLYLHVVKGGRAAYISARRPASDVEREMEAYGLAVGDAVRDGRWVFVEALTRSAREGLLGLARSRMEEGRWVLIDSLSYLASLGIYRLEVEDPAAQRSLSSLLKGLVRASRRLGGVHFVLATRGLMDPRSEVLVEDLVDYVLDFTYEVAPGRVARQILIKKASAPVVNPALSFKLTGEGVAVETVTRI
jgi:KaiC/GvpD/RAD55 family RecA-like ATPase